MIVSKDKKYKLRMDGEVILFEVDDSFAYGKYRVAPTSEWNALRWNLNGYYQDNENESCLDLIEISPYADLKIDDKVIAWDNADYQYKGHFAGVSEKTGKPLLWDGRRTSFTESNTVDFENCKKYEENND